MKTTNAASTQYTPHFHRASCGMVVKGPASQVAAGAVVMIDEHKVTISSCGRPWVGRDGVKWVYGHIAKIEVEESDESFLDWYHRTHPVT